MNPLLQKLIATTDEVDYIEMFDYFGLRFMTGDPAKPWSLEVRPDATPRRDPRRTVGRPARWQRVKTHFHIYSGVGVQCLR